LGNRPEVKRRLEPGRLATEGRERVRGGPLAGERRLGPWKALSLHGLLVEAVLVWWRVELLLDALPDDRRRQSFGSLGWVVVKSPFPFVVKPSEADWVA